MPFIRRTELRSEIPTPSCARSAPTRPRCAVHTARRRSIWNVCVFSCVWRVLLPVAVGAAGPEPARAGPARHSQSARQRGETEARRQGARSKGAKRKGAKRAAARQPEPAEGGAALGGVEHLGGHRVALLHTRTHLRTHARTRTHAHARTRTHARTDTHAHPHPHPHCFLNTLQGLQLLGPRT